MRFWFTSDEFNIKFEKNLRFLKEHYPEAHDAVLAEAKKYQSELEQRLAEDNPNYKFELVKRLGNKLTVHAENEERDVHAEEISEIERIISDL